MANATDKELALAKVYSRAMVDLAESQGQADSLLEELREVAALAAKDPQLGTFLSSPTVDTAVRTRVIEKAFRGKASDLLVDSLQVLNNKERLGLLQAVYETYRLAHEAMRNVIDVHVMTAVPLNDAMRAKVRDLVTAIYGKKAELVEKVDESVLGGISLRIGDDKLDSTVMTKLRKLSNAMRERASYEIHAGRSFWEAG